jgi:uncharacterized membrane protein YfcA
MPPLLLALLAAAIAGFSRGYAAFGTAMIFIPLITIAYDTRTAVVTLFLIDLLPAVPLLWRAVRHCDRSAMLWMGIGALAASPVGVAILLVVDSVDSQFILGVVLLAAVSTMILRPGLHFHTTRLNGVLAGAASGFAGGICGICGPPAMIYLLGRNAEAQRIRADAIVFLTIESLVLGATYLGYGIYTRWDIELSLLLLPAYGLATWCGARMFSHTGEAVYRRLMLYVLWLISILLAGRAAFELFL